jgi:hypothetical protein
MNVELRAVLEDERAEIDRGVAARVLGALRVACAIEEKLFTAHCVGACVGFLEVPDVAAQSAQKRVGAVLLERRDEALVSGVIPTDLREARLDGVVEQVLGHQALAAAVQPMIVAFNHVDDERLSALNIGGVVARATDDRHGE